MESIKAASRDRVISKTTRYHLGSGGSANSENGRATSLLSTWCTILKRDVLQTDTPRQGAPASSSLLEEGRGGNILPSSRSGAEDTHTPSCSLSSPRLERRLSRASQDALQGG